MYRSFIMTDILIIAIVILVIGSAAFYVIRSRKQGHKCIGCPYAKQAENGSCPCHQK